MDPSVGDHLEGNVEKRMYVYLFLTIRNTAIDQSSAICKKIQRRVNAIRRERGDNRARLRITVLLILSNKAIQDKRQPIVPIQAETNALFKCTTASARKPQREWTQVRTTP